MQDVGFYILLASNLIGWFLAGRYISKYENLRLEVKKRELKEVLDATGNILKGFKDFLEKDGDDSDETLPCGHTHAEHMEKMMKGMGAKKVELTPEQGKDLMEAIFGAMKNEEESTKERKHQSIKKQKND